MRAASDNQNVEPEPVSDLAIFCCAQCTQLFELTGDQISDLLETQQLKCPMCERRLTFKNGERDALLNACKENTAIKRMFCCTIIFFPLFNLYLLWREGVMASFAGALMFFVVFKMMASSIKSRVAVHCDLVSIDEVTSGTKQ